MPKSQEPKRPSWMDTYKSIRKEPVRPGQVIQPTNRRTVDDIDEEDVRQWETWRGEDLDDFEA